jgi:1-acyl-sn-glycerol-3-phosphate acyltransferase
MSNDQCQILDTPRPDQSDRPASSPRQTRQTPHSALRTPRSTIQRLWYRLCQFALRITGMLYYHLRYWGVKNIPRTGGVLIVSNHQSYLDPLLVGMGCPRPVNYVARESLFRFKPFGWLISSVNAFPIDREGIGLAGIKEALKRLKRGEMVLIFPEGTRTRDGEIGRLRPGFTTLAVRSKSAILPAAIEGAYRYWPRSQMIPRPGRIRVCYGQPIMPEEYANLDERELLEFVEIRLRQCYDQVRSLPGCNE